MEEKVTVKVISSPENSHAKDMLVPKLVLPEPAARCAATNRRWFSHVGRTSSAVKNLHSKAGSVLKYLNIIIKYGAIDSNAT